MDICLTGSVSDGSIKHRSKQFFSHEWNSWTYADNSYDGNITNSLLTRVGSSAGLTRVGSGTY